MVCAWGRGIVAPDVSGASELLERGKWRAEGLVSRRVAIERLLTAPAKDDDGGGGNEQRRNVRAREREERGERRERESDARNDRGREGYVGRSGGEGGEWGWR